ncbi:hypothetical protein ACP70R_045035 [Stipagrostis hirtigluma subsp. patula]
MNNSDRVKRPSIPEKPSINQPSKRTSKRNQPCHDNLASTLMLRFKKERAAMVRTMTFVRQTMDDRLNALYQDVIDAIPIDGSSNQMSISQEHANMKLSRTNQTIQFHIPIMNCLLARDGSICHASKEIMDYMRTASIHELQMNWIIHDDPRKICLTGSTLKFELIGRTPMSRDVLDVIIRRIQQTVNDTSDMYAAMHTKYLFETDFAIISCMNGRPVQSATVRKQFTVGLAKKLLKQVDKVFIPYMSNDSWSCIVINFTSKCARIYDPSQVYMKLHRNDEPDLSIGQNVIKSFTSCIAVFLRDNSFHISSWPIYPYTSTTTPCSIAESGLYIINFMFNYDEENIPVSMDKESLQSMRINILHALVHTEDNKGDMPCHLISLK